MILSGGGSFLFVLLLSLLAFSQVPEALPKWELGAGYFYGDIPDYPGSEESTVRAFPVPYFIYRGDIVRADREGGLRTRFLKGTMYELDFSFAGAFPANSEDNAARVDMPDLDWMFELGPQLRLFLLTDLNLRIQLRFPLRAVFATDFQDLNHRGYTFSPELRFSLPQFPFESQILNFSYTHENASTELHRYFYDVVPAYANATRPTYRAKNGHMADTYSISLVSRYKRLAVFTGMSVADHSKAENLNSPLLTAKYTRSFFAGFIFSMYQSEEQGQR